jgi:hypothetical protein
MMQYSKEDWEQEGSKMDEVYSGSYLAISADDALRPNPASSTHIICLPGKAVSIRA